MKVSGSTASTTKDSVNADRTSASKNAQTKTKAEIKKTEEDRWLKPQVKAEGGKVDPSKSFTDASPESKAYATKIFAKLSEQDPAKAELFMKTMVENLFKVSGTEKKDALRISADNALKAMVQSGVLTPANAEALHDSGVKEAHDLKNESDKATPVRNQRIATPSGTGGITKGKIAESTGAPKGFLWKPVSDNTGKLAVLLPPAWSKKDGTTVEVFGADGTSLGKGTFAGNGNGNRDHFRFEKPGSSFPSGSYVKAVVDGVTHVIQIDDPSSPN